MSSREQPCFPDFCIANKHYFQCVHQVSWVRCSHLCRGRFPLDVYRDWTWWSYIYQWLLYRVFFEAFSQSASSFYMAISSQNSQPINKKLNNDVIILARLVQRSNVRGACVGKFRKGQNFVRMYGGIPHFSNLLPLLDKVFPQWAEKQKYFGTNYLITAVITKFWMQRTRTTSTNAPKQIVLNTFRCQPLVG